MAVFNNPIAWAQIRLMGGWKNLAMTGATYVVILATVMAALVRGIHEPASLTFSGFVVLFFVLQALSLLVFGTARVATAVRSDVRSGVIESHRLMPMSPATAVFGYLFGAPFQALLLFFFNYCLGAAAVAGAGLPLDAWTFSNFILLAFSIFAWTIVLFFSFRSALALWAAIVCFVLVPWLMMPINIFLPGASILASPMLGGTVFDLKTAYAVDWPFGVALAAQGLIAGIYFFAATRRYRSPDAIGFGPMLGVLLLGIWVAVSIAGVMLWNDATYSGRWRWERDIEMAFVTTYALVLLLAILPIASAVRLSSHRRPAFLALAVSPIGAVLVVTAIAFVLVNIAPFFSYGSRREALIRTAITTFVFCISIRYLLGIVYRTRLRPRLTVLGWLLLLWCAPVLIEATLFATMPDWTDRRISQVSMCSPLVEVYQTWSHDRLIHSEQFGGLLFQCAVAAGLALLYHTAFRRRGALDEMDMHVAAVVG